MAVRKPPRNRWVSQAQADALLQFAPKRSSLAEALQEAKESYGQTVRAGRTSAQLTKRATEAAKPGIQAVYRQADAAVSPAVTLLSRALSGLPSSPSVDAVKAGAAAEGAQQIGNLATRRAADEAMLHKQGVAAAAGQQFTQQNALQVLRKAVGQILSKRQAIAGEEGAAAASGAERLANEAEKLEADERQAERTAQTSRENSEEGSRTSRANTRETNRRQEREGDGPNGTKLKLRTPGEQGKAATTLREIERTARGLRRRGANRGKVLDELTAPHKGANVEKTDEAGRVIHKSNGEPEYERTPDAPAYDQLLAEAAIDSVYGYGRVSKATLRKLHNAGYSLSALDLQGPGPPPKPKPGIPGSKFHSRTRRQRGY